MQDAFDAVRTILELRSAEVAALVAEPMDGFQWMDSSPPPPMPEPGYDQVINQRLALRVRQAPAPEPLLLTDPGRF